MIQFLQIKYPAICVFRTECQRREVFIVNIVTWRFSWQFSVGSCHAITVLCTLQTACCELSNLHVFQNLSVFALDNA